jgi:hypothetical protein
MGLDGLGSIPSRNEDAWGNEIRALKNFGPEREEAS